MINEVYIFLFSLILYIVAFALYIVSISLDRPKLYKPARIAAWIGVISALTGLGLRWYSAGHPPLSNMYESMVTLSCFITLVGLFMTKTNGISILEAGACIASVLMYGVASVFSSQAKPLIPALQSYWLHLHVSMAFIGEALFAIAFILSYLLCFRKVITDTGDKSNFNSTAEKGACYSVVIALPTIFIVAMGFLAKQLSYDERWKGLAGGVILPSIITVIVLAILAIIYRGAASRKVEKWLPECDALDNLIYRAIALGYPIFTVGAIIFGMVWANKAWGRYWGWDPKETWALITFLVYSIYLHVRLARGWNGVWTACLSIVGFLVTMFTLFGVNFLISGLHSYT